MYVQAPKFLGRTDNSVPKKLLLPASSVMCMMESSWVLLDLIASSKESIWSTVHAAVDLHNKTLKLSRKQLDLLGQPSYNSVTWDSFHFKLSWIQFWKFMNRFMHSFFFNFSWINVGQKGDKALKHHRTWNYFPFWLEQFPQSTSYFHACKY